MQSRLVLRRVFLLRTAKPSTSAGAARFFTRHTNLTSQNRPQLPFLSVPLARNHQFRYLTTERKRWLVYEVVLGFKYIVYTWAIGACLLIAYYSVQQEWLERRYPSPHEWSFVTRLRFRLLRWGPDRNDTPEPNWVQIGNYARNILERLEDPNIDGAGLRDLTEGGIYIADVGKSGYDVTGKSEPWRRGYYEVLMNCAKAAEQLDNHVLDTKRGVVFPADQVFGPSNPSPKPIPPGSPSAPHEKDCEPFYEPPETYYMRILTTRGFTNKQKMDTALEYASWLDFKGVPEAAERMYEWALQLATENTPQSALPYDTTKYVLREGADSSPSTNLLTSLTAFAAHKARNGELSASLPMLISILRARRSLPATASRISTQPEIPVGTKTPWSAENIIGVVKRFVAPPAYPPPPPDGNSPPIRDAKGLCEEAGLNVYIGEIMYASRSGAAGREEGLAWTREAVDIAEEQLRKLTSDASLDDDATKTCKECLSAGLDNWMKMASKLAKEEKERKESAISVPSSRWFGLWGDGQAKADDNGRWAAEEHVVQERVKRSQDLLDELDAPKSGIGSLFRA
ncbi:MFS maltose permease [Seiridium cupressi]